MDEVPWRTGPVEGHRFEGVVWECSPRRTCRTGVGGLIATLLCGIQRGALPCACTGCWGRWLPLGTRR